MCSLVYKDSFVNLPLKKNMGDNYKVIEMDTSYKWWDRWFVVANMTIDRLLADYCYSNLSPVYLLTRCCKNHFLVRKPRRNLQNFWSRCDIIAFIDHLGGLLTAVHKVCGDDIFAVTQDRVTGDDGRKRQRIYVFFAVECKEDADNIEKYLFDNNYTFIMSDDVPFTD